MKSSIPVFLVGCGRSGTNMITRHLATSPDVELFNEDHPAAFERYHLRPIPDIRRLIEDSEATFVLFKPILDTHRCLTWLEFFSKAQILYVTRHFDDVINSALRRFGPLKWSKAVKGWMKRDFARFAPQRPPETTRDALSSLWRTSLSPPSSYALYWIFFNRLFFDLKLNRDRRARLVRYESTVSHPEREFHDICCFLNIDYSERMAADISSSSIGKDIKPAIDEDILSACKELWIKLLHTEEYVVKEQNSLIGF